MLDAIEIKIRRYHEDLAFEIGRAPNDPVFKFVISANGDPENIDAVVRLAKAAPDLVNWKIVPFRPRLGGYELNYEGHELNASMMRYTLDLTVRPPDLTLYIDGMTEDNANSLRNGAFILLHDALGEFDVMTKLRYIDIEPMTVEVHQETLEPFDELAVEIDRISGEQTH